MSGQRERERAKRRRGKNEGLRGAVIFNLEMKRRLAGLVNGKHPPLLKGGRGSLSQVKGNRKTGGRV